MTEYMKQKRVLEAEFLAYAEGLFKSHKVAGSTKLAWMLQFHKVNLKTMAQRIETFKTAVANGERWAKFYIESCGSKEVA